MSNASSVEHAAEMLRRAGADGTPCAPVREVLGTRTDIDLAYQVQALNVALAVQGGRQVKGHKIGLTSTAVQAQLGVDQPDFGVLFSDMEVGDGVDVDGSRLLQPRAEAEVALVLGRDLNGPQVSFVDVVNAVDYALPSIEVVDSRVAEWDISLVDTIADNASCGVYVVGSRPVSLRDVDLRSVPMQMTMNGAVVSEGSGDACMGNPIEAARWLANVMVGLGSPLRAGEVIMTGALGPMVAVADGDELVADIGPLGSVRTRIVGGN